MTQDQITGFIASEQKLRPFQVQGTMELLAEGATVPFIARYRKERTGGLDEVQIRSVRDRCAYLRELEERRATILRTIEEAGRMTPGLRAGIEACLVKQELEDLYLPYRPKRRTRAAAAREKGLEPLAFLLWRQEESVAAEDAAASFVDPSKGVESVEDALEGAKAVIAEIVSDDAGARKQIQKITLEKGLLASKVKKKYKEEKTKFSDYYDHGEPLRGIPSHRFLALMRGEMEEVLSVKIEAPEEEILKFLEGRFIKNAALAQTMFLREAMTLAYGGTIAGSIERELRGETKERADDEAIGVFTENLRHLLLAPPAGSRVIMGIDPGQRTGCKVAVIDGTGKLLDHATIYPHPPQGKEEEAERKITELVRRHGAGLAAIGNGTASRETDLFVRAVVRKNPGVDLQPVVVSESGASVYSASDVAREELPGLDVSVRGAVSIARRLQDPLAELVKIDPKSIGVGQYQHDVDQARLMQALEETVESCVNFVGVDLNTASSALLRYVSGVSESTAKNIVAARDARGKFKERRELLDVPRFGPKAFEQAAGFLRISNGRNPLDNSAVHPESYPIVEAMAADLGVELGRLVGDEKLVRAIDAKRYVTQEAGLPTVNDILAELIRPGRDPREKFDPVVFAEGITDIGQLKEGTVLEGIVTNVTRFGAFVDVGVHQDGLVHVSQLSDRFVKDPADVVKVGQKVKVRVLGVDVDRRRISLSMKGMV
jgi:uncharacterized protein